MINHDAVIPPVQAPFMETPVPGKRVWSGWATAGIGILILIAFFLAQVIVAGIIAFVFAFPKIRAAGTSQYDALYQIISNALNSHLGLLQSLATIFSGLVGLGLILVFIRAKKGESIKEYLGLNKISIGTALLSIGIIVGYNFAVVGIQSLLGSGVGQESITTDLYKTAISPVLFGIAVVIFAPLFEEAMFRGFLFEGFRQSRVGIVGAVIITALVWAELHSIQYQTFNVLVIFVLGLIMGVVRWRTKTIWSTFIMHATMNLIAIITIALSIKS